MYSICAVCAIQYYNIAIHCMILYICLSQGWRGTFLPVACKIREAWFKKSQDAGRKRDCFFSSLLQLSFMNQRKNEPVFLDSWPTITRISVPK